MATLYERLNDRDIEVKEICLLKMAYTGINYEFASTVLPHFFYRMVSLITEPTATTLIKVKISSIDDIVVRVRELC